MFVCVCVWGLCGTINILKYVNKVLSWGGGEEEVGGPPEGEKKKKQT